MSSANVYLESKVCKRRRVDQHKAPAAWMFRPSRRAGYVRVPGHRHRSCGDIALHVQGLLQPRGGVPLTTRQTQSLQLRLVQRFRSGAPPHPRCKWSITGTVKHEKIHKLIRPFAPWQSGRSAGGQRSNLHRVWGHSFLLGAASDKFGGGFLQSPEAQPESGKIIR